MAQETEREEKPYNYLEEYLTDNYADVTGETPIVFDWSNVHKVDPVEVVPFLHPEMAEASKKRGMPVMKVLVSCTEHGYFHQVMKDPYDDTDLWCYHCITREINRIINLRSQREWERRRRMARS